MLKAHVGKAAIFFAFFGCGVSGLLLLGRSYYGLGLSEFVLFATCIASAWDAMRAPVDGRGRPAAWSITIAIALALVLGSVDAGVVTRIAGIRMYKVPSTSMEPTIMVGERVVADHHAYRHTAPQRREVIIFRKSGSYVVKRVIAVGGDRISGINGEIRLNGVLLQEPYAKMAERYDPQFDFPPMAIPEGKLFVAGDSRQYSLDSRVQGYGLVDVHDVVGRPLYIYWSNTDRRLGARIR